MSIEDPGGDRQAYATQWGGPIDKSMATLQAWLARGEHQASEPLTAEGIAKGIDAKVEQKVWEQSEAQVKEQWKQCANLKLDKNGDPIKEGGVQRATGKLGGAWPITNQTPTIGWSCPNCGRCFAPHVASCSQCIGMQYWPHPGGICPPSQPSPWWQVPLTSPWTYGTVTVPSYAPAAPGSSPSSGTYDTNEYQTRLDG